MFSTHLLLLQNEESTCRIVCSADIQVRVHVSSAAVCTASVVAVPQRTRVAYPVTIVGSASIVGRPGGSTKSSSALIAGVASIEVHAGAVRPQGTCSILGVAGIAATTVDVTIVGTASVVCDTSEPYGAMLGRANVLCTPYAIHNANFQALGQGGLGTLASVIHFSDPLLVESEADIQFGGEMHLAAQVRMDGIARFRAVGTYYIDGTLNLWGRGDAIFQALLNFGGLLPSGSVRKTYLVDDSKVRFVSPASVGLSLGAHSRYLPVSLVVIDDLIAMGPMRFPYIEEDFSDVILTVGSGDEFRLDIISMRAYGTAHLWWVIATANGIRNPFTDPEVGSRLRIPALDRIYREVVGKVA